MKDIKRLISVKVKSMFEQNQLSDRMKQFMRINMKTK